MGDAKVANRAATRETILLCGNLHFSDSTTPSGKALTK